MNIRPFALPPGPALRADVQDFIRQHMMQDIPWPCRPKPWNDGGKARRSKKRDTSAATAASAKSRIVAATEHRAKLAGEVMRLRGRGMGVRAIADQMGIAHKTVTRVILDQGGSTKRPATNQLPPASPPDAIRGPLEKGSPMVATRKAWAVARRAEGYTLAQLSEALGIRASTVSLIIIGKPKQRGQA